MIIILLGSSFEIGFPNFSRASGSSSEPLLPINDNISKSFTPSNLSFMGQNAANLTESITWYQNGSTNISDSMGDSLTMAIPVSPNLSFTLLQNSTMVDQKLVSPSLQYDIYWNQLQNSNGTVDRYKMTIVGTSANGSEIQFPITSSENMASNATEVLTTKGAASVLSSSLTDANMTQGGLCINWSDAIAEGYKMSFDQIHSSLDVTVGKTFSIDPTIVTTVTTQVSPASNDYYEGERRVVDIGGNLLAFYFDGTNLVYRNSTNNGNTWSTSSYRVGPGTGALATDNYRWTIGSTTYLGHNYVSLVYWYVNGNNTLIRSIRGNVTQGSAPITWANPQPLSPSIVNQTSTGCGSGMCVAANMANDTNGNLFLVTRWLNSTAQLYEREVYKSVNAGYSFSRSAYAHTTNQLHKIEPVLTRLANGNMLMVEANYNTTEFTYWIYSASNSSWSSNPYTTSGAGMTVNAIKQISADSDTSNEPYVAYVTGNAAGTLKVARWNNDGTFNTFETVDSTLSHTLPSITITQDNIVHIYTIASNQVYETDKVGSLWLAPDLPFDSYYSFTSPNELTAGISYPAFLWEEGSTSPYNLKFGTNIHNIYHSTVTSTGNFTSGYITSIGT